MPPSFTFKPDPSRRRRPAAKVSSCTPTKDGGPHREITQLEIYRKELLKRTHGSSARSISASVQEPAFRAAFGCEQFEDRVDGLIDAWTVPGTDAGGRGWECKTLLVSDRASRARLWPADMPEGNVVVPVRRARWLGDDPILIEFEHARIPGPIRLLARFIDRDPADAGDWLMGQLRDRYERAISRRRVGSVAYALLLRDPSGAFLAHAEHPLTFPLRPANTLVWEWQQEPDDDAATTETEPTCLQAFEPSGMLVARWYLRGGQVRERIAVPPAALTRMRVGLPHVGKTRRGPASEVSKAA